MACSRIRPVRSKSEPRIRVMTVHICNVSWSRHVHFLPRDRGHLPPEHLDERPAWCHQQSQPHSYPSCTKISPSCCCKDAGRHEFTHYATPTRRIDNTRLMHCDVLYPSMSCSVLEIRLAAVGESPWAPYIQAVLEVQTRVLIRNDVRHFCDMLILCLASLILGSAHVSRKRHGEGNQIIFSQSTDLKICRHDLKFRTFCIVSFPTSHKLLYCLKEKSLQRTFLGKT